MGTLHRQLQYINPQDIAFDKDNPRGLTEDQIVNDPNFKKLKSSIEEYGILEPVIIKKDESNEAAYVLIDGERRLRAALAADQKEVPSLIAKDDTDGRILAYQVHMLRNNWDKAAETKAIKKLIGDLRNENPSITEDAIKAKLIKITAHKDHELNDILELIKYDDHIIESVISKQLNMSYLVQIERSFINPLKRHYDGIVTAYGEDNIRRILIQKAIDGNLVNTRFLMDKFKVVFADEMGRKDKISKILISFLGAKNKSIQKSLDEYSNLDKHRERKAVKTPKKAVTSKTALAKKESQVEIFSYKKIRVTKKQLTSIEDIRANYEKIGTSYSEEENEYIAEALFCLEKHCFKAATLMIWSSGISRILNYIGSNLADFNKATTNMIANPTNVYKYIAKNFMKGAGSVDDIRLNSNDRHVISFIYFKNFITETQCKKLFSDYSTRCDCAHPTDIKISPNQAISIFENIYDLILNNPKIK